MLSHLNPVIFKIGKPNSIPTAFLKTDIFFPLGSYNLLLEDLFAFNLIIAAKMKLSYGLNKIIFTSGLCCGARGIVQG